MEENFLGNVDFFCLEGGELVNKNYLNMSINDFLFELDKKDKEIERLKKQMSDQNETIEIIGKQNRNMKKSIARYQERLTEVLYKEKIRNCSTCKNNVEFPPAHTCDICTSLDQVEYGMWEAK